MTKHIVFLWLLFIIAIIVKYLDLELYSLWGCKTTCLSFDYDFYCGCVIILFFIIFCIKDFLKKKSSIYTYIYVFLFFSYLYFIFTLVSIYLFGDR